MDKAYLRFAAGCAAALAVTTFLLWLLPQLVPEAPNFDARLALGRDPANLARHAVGIVHMLLGFAAMLGVYFLLRERSRGFAAFGLAMFFTWMVVEIVASSIALFTVNLGWRAGYAAAGPEAQVAFRALLAGWPAVYDGLYFVFGTAFVIGSITYGVLALRGGKRAALAGVFMLMGAGLGIAFLVSGYNGPAWPGMLAGHLYPILMPSGRGLIAWWLWREAAQPHPGR